MKPICTVHDIVTGVCENTVYARGLCRRHYVRWQRGYAVEGTYLLRRPPPRCTVHDVREGPCTRDADHGFGMCHKHYMRQYRGRPAEGRRHQRDVLCGASDDGVPCDRPAVRRHLCHKHYVRQWRTGRLDARPYQRAS